MNYRVFLVAALLTISNQLCCSHKMKRPPAINLDELEQSDLPPVSRHSSKDMGVRRELSQGYSRLMQQLTSLQMQKDPKERDFAVFCKHVQRYTQENLGNLAKNKLLYDDGSDHVGNDFNDVLLKSMREFAQQHNFSEELIPFVVVVSDDELSVQSSESDVRDPEIEEEVEKRVQLEKWLQQKKKDRQKLVNQRPSVVDENAQDVVAALLLKKD